MAPFSLPAPSIIPLRLPVFGGSKSIDTKTKIQLLCETYLNHEIFYTLDGTKPQPYSGIVQGSKHIKYCSPFCLPPGKITMKAVAVNANVHTMRSNIVTRYFEVLKVDSVNNKKSANMKLKKNSKLKKKCDSVESIRHLNETIAIQDENNVGIHRSNHDSMKDEEDILNCFDEAFIGNSEFDIEKLNTEDSMEDDCSPVNDDVSDKDISGGSDDVQLCDVTFHGDDSISEDIEELLTQEENKPGTSVMIVNDSGESADTQFCCIKCDLTLQQCISCNRMNGVSSKFCIGCGKQLSRICNSCKEYNPSVATFCQYCGMKLNSRSVSLRELLKVDQVDHSILAKPESENVAVQMLPVMIDKNVQTFTSRSPVKKNVDCKRIPHHSPGRGYWHQQLDYICNNLKTHAYNNIEFRNEISEPMLCDFKSVHIAKDEENVTVTVVFSALKDKTISEELKTETKEDT